MDGDQHFRFPDHLGEQFPFYFDLEILLAFRDDGFRTVRLLEHFNSDFFFGRRRLIAIAELDGVFVRNRFREYRRLGMIVVGVPDVDIELSCHFDRGP